MSLLFARKARLMQGT